MVFFIPCRMVAEESGAAHFGFGGAMLLDLPGPALRLLTGDVDDFHFSDIAVRGADGAQAIGANDDAAAVELRGAPTPLIESRVELSAAFALIHYNGGNQGLGFS
jgi:hypothetical protein